MSSRRQWQRRPEIDRHRLLELARESAAVAGLVIHDHDYPAYRPAVFACCYAVIRVGEGARRLDSRSRRRLRSVSLAVWAEWRNTLAHDLEMLDDSAVLRMVGEELPLLLGDLERLAG